MKFTSKIGRVIQTNRKAAGLSRIALAELAGVGKTAVYDVENGKETVRLDILLALLDALNIKLIIDAPMEVTDEES